MMHASAPRSCRALLARVSLAAAIVTLASCSLAGLATTASGAGASGAGSSSGSEASGSSSGGAGLLYEAEDAGLYGKFVVVDDPDASAGKYVIVPTGAGCSDGLSEVVFDVEVAAAGSYVIWARVQATDPSHDSFLVSADMGPEALFSVGEPSTFVEDAVTDSSSDLKTAVHYAWDAGRHTVTFRCREDGTSLDRIRLDLAPP